jgi:hypothetical protein
VAPRGGLKKKALAGAEALGCQSLISMVNSGWPGKSSLVTT